jgi:hypothetical protein
MAGVAFRAIDGRSNTMKLKRRPAAGNPIEQITLEERLAQVRYLALQRWAKHVAALAETQERQARAIATHAVANIEAQSGAFSPSDRKALIAALTTREFAHLVACVSVIMKDAETVAAGSPALAAALTDAGKDTDHG